LDVGDDVNGLAWQPDGKVLHTAGGRLEARENATRAWHIENNHAESYPWYAFSVASSSAGDVCFGLLDAVVHVGADRGSQPMRLSGHVGHVDTVAFSPRGERFASASPDRTIRVWDTARNVCTQVFTGHTGRIQSLAFSPRGLALASAGYDGTIKLWNDEPMDRTVREFESRSAGASAGVVAISSDLRYLALNSQLDEVRVYRLDDGSLVGSLPTAKYPRGLQFVPGRPVLFAVAVGSVDRIDEWDVENWRSIRVHGMPSGSREVALWGRYLVVKHNTATVLLTNPLGGNGARLPGNTKSLTLSSARRNSYFLPTE
jgi:WD40 repeat protein